MASSESSANSDLIERLRAARQIAETCARAAQFAVINFWNPESNKLAIRDCDGFRQHCELWFGRWQTLLSEFDATIDAALLERIQFAARNLEPVVISGFHFPTAFEVARYSLQCWGVNLQRLWELDKEWLAPTERCQELLKVAEQLPRAGFDLGARIVREWSLAVAEVTPAESQAVVADDFAFIDAKTLYDLRNMKAPQGNKFLKKHGTTSDQPVEGKVRFRKPNKRALFIHSGDWHTYWKDIDRRQFDALGEDSMQAFLMNTEAAKAAEKANRKRSRTSSRQVSNLGQILQ